MNIVLVFAFTAILVGTVDSDIKQQYTRDTTQKVLLRKLQNFQQNEAKTVTWNEILANVLVTKISNKNDGDNANKGNVLSKCFSEVLRFYKTFVYDKLLRRNNNAGSDNTDDREINEDIVIDTTPAIQEEETKNRDPKSDVELIEPAYHGKLEEATEVISIASAEESSTNPKCPEGTQKDAEGNCIDPKASRFILHIPSQCPIGYKKDWLGYCREIF